MEFTIGTRTIGNNHLVFIIAEMSCNHLQNYGYAVEIIKKAKEAEKPLGQGTYELNDKQKRIRETERSFPDMDYIQSIISKFLESVPRKTWKEERLLSGN